MICASSVVTGPVGYSTKVAKESQTQTSGVSKHIQDIYESRMNG